MEYIYKHTQTGYTTIILLMIGFIIAAYGTIAYGENIFVLVVLFIITICFPLFFSLTITIDNEYLSFSFGIGIIKRRFPLKEIQSFRIVRNAWYYGWGIRLTPHGWLYNVSGFTALEIVLKSGRRHRIGTDNAEDLKEALKKQGISTSG